MVERKLREKWSFKCQIISLFIYLVSYEVVWWSCSSLLFYNKFSWFLLNRHLRQGELYNYHDQYSVLNSIGIHLRHGRVHWPVSSRGYVLYSYIARSYCMLSQWLYTWDMNCTERFQFPVHTLLATVSTEVLSNNSENLAEKWPASVVHPMELAVG